MIDIKIRTDNLFRRFPKSHTIVDTYYTREGKLDVFLYNDELGIVMVDLNGGTLYYDDVWFDCREGVWNVIYDVPSAVDELYRIWDVHPTLHYLSSYTNNLHYTLDRARKVGHPDFLTTIWSRSPYTVRYHSRQKAFVFIHNGRVQAISGDMNDIPKELSCIASRFIEDVESSMIGKDIELDRISQGRYTKLRDSLKK